jgi:hypothetical protein
MLFLSLETDVMYLQKVISKTNWEKTYFLLAFWKTLTKTAGSGSVNQVYGSKDPDPYKNVTDPENCWQAFVFS